MESQILTALFFAKSYEFHTLLLLFKYTLKQVNITFLLFSLNVHYIFLG